MTIPDFAPNGSLPPFVNGDPTTPANRSPYNVDIFQVINRFCTTEARAKLLLGLNQYRKHLFEGGFVSGSQWIDGSFVQDVEKTRSRSPRDIDVVTLFYRPIKYQINQSLWIDDYQNFIHREFFDSRQMKANFKCDTYCIDLDADVNSLVRDTSYWNGLFSDIRGSTEKKGILCIPLANDKAEFLAVSDAIGRICDV